MQSARYRILEPLGRGGQAEVHAAILEGEGGFRRRVALKRLLPELRGDSTCVHMFLDEARIGSQLHHANVVGVLDFGEADGVPYQVVELVDGHDLDHWLRRAREKAHPPSEAVSLYIVAQVARGLHAAHEARDPDGRWLAIVHRDVSPANVLIARDGQVKLTDFGVALAQGRLVQTEGPWIKGKLAYMAPEQAMRGEVDLRADVFALGCVLHTLLLGQSPTADLTELTALALGEELRLDSRLPADLSAFLQRALASKPGRRHATAAAFAEEAGRLLTHYAARDPVSLLGDWVCALSQDEPASRGPQPLLDAFFALPEESARSLAAPAPADVATPPSAQALPPARVRSARGRAMAVGAWAAFLGLVLAWWMGAAGAPVAAPRAAPMPTQAPVAPTVPLRAHQAPPSAEAAAPASVLFKESVPSKAPVPRSARIHRTKLTTDTAAGMEEPGATGTLVVGGPGAQRAALRIDGRDVGFAPKRIDLPVGEHTLWLRSAEGAESTRTLRIGREHTDSAPYRVMMP
jgi:serine/threonine-protein kinase